MQINGCGYSTKTIYQNQKASQMFYSADPDLGMRVGADGR